MVHINLKGVERLLAKTRAAEKALWPTVMGVIHTYVDKMVQDAKANAPYDMGEVQSSIGKEQKDEHTVVFYMASAHGVMQELGTGTRMLDIPDMLEEEARKFKGYKGGNMAEFVAELREWCVRKGIDPDAAYIIAVTLLEEGTRPQPFFYPAFQRWEGPMVEEIKQKVAKLFDF